MYAVRHWAIEIERTTFSAVTHDMAVIIIHYSYCVFCEQTINWSSVSIIEAKCYWNSPALAPNGYRDSDAQTSSVAGREQLRNIRSSRWAAAGREGRRLVRPARPLDSRTSCRDWWHQSCCCNSNSSDVISITSHHEILKSALTAHRRDVFYVLNAWLKIQFCHRSGSKYGNVNGRHKK